MRQLINLAIVLILIQQPVVVLASESSKSLRKEIHNNFSGSTASTFVEDVYSLLPLDMKEYLKRDYKSLETASRINLRHNYWNKGIISKEHFSNICKNIKVTTSSQLAEELGSTVENVFEVAMSLENDNPFANGLQNNIKYITNIRNDFNYEIIYLGYNKQSIDYLVERLYLLKKQDNKLAIFPDIITLTADIWGAIWVANGNKPIIETRTIVREPGFLEVSSNNNNTTIISNTLKKEQSPKINSEQSYNTDQRSARLERLERIRRISNQRAIYRDSIRFSPSGNMR